MGAHLGLHLKIEWKKKFRQVRVKQVGTFVIPIDCKNVGTSLKNRKRIPNAFDVALQALTRSLVTGLQQNFKTLFAEVF